MHRKCGLCHGTHKIIESIPGRPKIVDDGSRTVGNQDIMTREWPCPACEKLVRTDYVESGSFISDARHEEDLKGILVNRISEFIVDKGLVLFTVSKGDGCLPGKITARVDFVLPGEEGEKEERRVAEKNDFR